MMEKNSLYEKVYRKHNLYEAYKKVKSNKGNPGIDGITFKDFDKHSSKEFKLLHHELKTEAYRPLPVKRVKIPKSKGKERLLGIPAVRDRVVQQALLNTIQPIFNPTFHPDSYGYRPKRSCHGAVSRAKFFMVNYCLTHVVDMDLSKCFDTLEHGIIIESVEKKISDRRILNLIRLLLRAKVMENNILYNSYRGSPQGGVISPLLCNIYLDYFDKEMEKRGINLVRYADDILLFAESKEQALQYKKTAIEILEGELKLKVNLDKTYITNIEAGVPYLGFVIYSNKLSIHPKKKDAFNKKIRSLTQYNSGKDLEKVIIKLNEYLIGWINYFELANCKGFLKKSMKRIKKRVESLINRDFTPLSSDDNLTICSYKEGKFLHFSWANKSLRLIDLELYAIGNLFLKN